MDGASAAARMRGGGCMRGGEHLIVRSDGGREIDGLVDQVGVPAAGWHWPAAGWHWPTLCKAAKGRREGPAKAVLCARPRENCCS